MAAKKLETASGNSINSLPDEVLGQILSLLPSKTAASTSVLSKRWRNLFPLVHNVDFDESMFLDPNINSDNLVIDWFYHERFSRSFFNFMEKTLVLLRDSHIKKFSLKWESLYESRANHLIHNMLRRGVLELQLSTSTFHCLEPDFFFSKTLVKLILSDGHYYQSHRPPGGVLFPALKTLSLYLACFVAFERCGLYDCLLASPVLEEVNICDDDPLKPLVYSTWVKQIWGSSIQRISICYCFYDIKEHSCFVIKTPNLVYLDFSSYVGQDYVVQFDSLVKSRLDLRLWKYLEYVPPEDAPSGYDLSKHDSYWGDATNLIAAIRNVVTLHLSADSLEVFYFCCKSMPEFNNLVKLSFESHKERGWQVLPLLLKKSTNLETLVIKGLVHEITDECGDACVCVHDELKKNKNCLLSCRVKVLKIYGYGGTNREVKQMRHFIENLKCLEVVKVKVQVDEQDKYLPPTSELMKLLSAASSKCKIQFI